ncbi:unnamed protein product [Victoria cruziana]
MCWDREGNKNARSSVSFRRQGSSGRIWDDHFIGFAKASASDQPNVSSKDPRLAAAQIESPPANGKPIPRKGCSFSAIFCGRKRSSDE